MKKQKWMKRIICGALVLAMVVPTILSVAVSAVTLPVDEVDGIDSVSAYDFMTNMDYLVSDIQDDAMGAGLSVVTEDHVLNIFENSQQVYLDGAMYSLETEEVTDETTGETYLFPVSKNPVEAVFEPVSDANGEDQEITVSSNFYIPVEFLTSRLGMEEPVDGAYNFEKETETEAETTEDGTPAESQETTAETTTEERVYTVVPEDDLVSGNSILLD